MEEGDSSGSAARAFTAEKNKKASGSLSDRAGTASPIGAAEMKSAIVEGF
jgi:hypothetical protein